MTGISVLYVDDEPDLLELSRLFLEQTGEFSVATTASADEALRILEKTTFDCIISDYQMPEMNGIALLIAIRSAGNPVPFILFTGRGREEVVIEAINNGADFYIQKGGDIKAQFSELAHKINHAVMRRRAELALAESRDYLDLIFSSVQAGIMIIDTVLHTIIDVNPTAASMIGLKKEEIIGKMCHEYVCPAGHGKCPITDLGRTVDNSERILITANGSRIPIIKYVTKVRISGRDCLLETFIDNSERKRAEEQLRLAYDELKKSEAQTAAAYAELAANEKILVAESRKVEDAMILANRKLRMLNDVTRHEIRNIVTGLVGLMDMAQVVQSDAERNTLFHQKKDLIAALQKQLAFTEQYQEIGIRPPRWQRIGTMIPSFSSLRILLDTDLADTEIFADPLAPSAFLSLAENTILHGGHATGIRIHATEGETGLTLFLDDNGVGIPEERKAAIFEHCIGSREGMSLFLVREILGTTGITITETGKPGQGARFELAIPPGGYRVMPAPRDAGTSR